VNPKHARGVLRVREKNAFGRLDPGVNIAVFIKDTKRNDAPNLHLHLYWFVKIHPHNILSFPNKWIKDLGLIYTNE